MNIFIRELKANFKSLLIWSGIVFVFVLIGFSKFSAYANNPELLVILDSMPKAILDALNMKAFNLTTVTGFYGIMYIYFGLMLSIASVMWGSDTISKEERDKTVEFSLTLPVTRGRLITAKTLAAVVNCIALLGVTWVSTIVAAASYSPDSKFYTFLALGSLAMFIMQMIFLAIGVFLGSAMKHYKQASSLAVSILLGTFFIYIISGLNEKLDFLKYFSPFKYFNPADMLHKANIDINFVLLSVGIIAACMFGAYLTYARRDLYI
ncbi:MAG: ABC transporter permease subunit [Chloroflexota bacterium]